MSGLLDLLSSLFTETSGGCSKPVPPQRRNVQKKLNELEQSNAALAAALEKFAQQQADQQTALDQQAGPAPRAAPDQQDDPTAQDDPAPRAAPDQQDDPTAQDDPAASS